MSDSPGDSDAENGESAEDVLTDVQDEEPTTTDSGGSSGEASRTTLDGPSEGNLDTTEEIMEATYRALCADGFASLTMQNIADECDKSTSLLHYHYDTKEELLVAFIEYILEDFEATVAQAASGDPGHRLVEFVSWFVLTPEDTDREAFHTALLELRSQAAFNERYRDQLKHSDDLLREAVADILSEGIEDGVFESVDVHKTAALLVATLDGARTRQLTLGDDRYTEVVATTTLERIVEPIRQPSATLPPLDDFLENSTDSSDETADNPDGSTAQSGGESPE